jgi:hypothetical protein
MEITGGGIPRQFDFFQYDPDDRQKYGKNKKCLGSQSFYG